MQPRRALRLPFPLLAAILLAAAPAAADYDSHPELRPGKRCAKVPEGVTSPDDPGGVDSIHCQRLLWDLSAATRVGFVAAAAPIPGERAPRFPNGLTDRPPPLYVGKDGEGFEGPGPGRERLCPDPDEIPWWKPGVDEAGEPVVGKDPTYGHAGPLYEVACRRGTRVRFGPWQGGTSADVEESLVEGVLRLESSARLDRDVELRGLDEKKQGRREWLRGLEFYNHMSLHHVICWNPEHPVCNDPNDPWSASDPEKCRAGYQEVADGPDEPGGPGGCYAGDQDTRCVQPAQTAQTARHLATTPGRVTNEFPEGHGDIALEDHLMRCYHHVTHEFPPDPAGHDAAFHRVTGEGYGLQHVADHRLQKGGLVNTADVLLHDTKPGDVIGGVVGEIIVQYFTEPFTRAELKPLPKLPPVRTGGLADFVEKIKKKANPGTAGEAPAEAPDAGDAR